MGIVYFLSFNEHRGVDEVETCFGCWGIFVRSLAQSLSCFVHSLDISILSPGCVPGWQSCRISWVIGDVKKKPGLSLTARSKHWCGENLFWDLPDILPANMHLLLCRHDQWVFPINTEPDRHGICMVLAGRCSTAHTHIARVKYLFAAELPRTLHLHEGWPAVDHLKNNICQAVANTPIDAGNSWLKFQS